jgi:hypothetical protein
MQPAESASRLQIVDLPAMREQHLRLHCRVPPLGLWDVLSIISGGGSDSA